VIGWNDDRFRELVEKSTQTSGGKTCDPFSGDRQKIERLGFGLMNIFTDTLVEHLVQSRPPQERTLAKEKGMLSVVGITDHSKGIESIEITGASEGTQSRYSLGRMRDTPLYKAVLDSFKYQRDVYTSGESFAKLRNFERNLLQQKNDENRSPLGDLAKIATGTDSMAQVQLNDLAGWFLCSSIVVDALRPTVLWTISGPNSKPHYLPMGGPLYAPFLRAVIDLIPMSQTSVDSVVKQNVVWFLSDDQWKQQVKGRTGGYVSKMQRDFSDDQVQS